MIKITDLDFGYNKQQLLFKKLSMQLSAGHIYGLLGKNGAGKSSLLKNMAGLVYALSGKIDVMGFDPAKRQPALLKQVCFIPEEFDLPSVKIDAYVKANAAFYPNFNHSYFKELLAEFDIPVAQKLVNMSYGQKKKLIIAFGLATQAQLIIMDEPTNGLDIPSKAQFRKIMAAALTEDRCIIISTHQVRDLDNLIDTVIMLDESSIALKASVEEITDKLCFKRIKELDETVIYAEPSLSGYNALMPNYHKEESKLDMELLFNAVLAEKTKIKIAFN
ncbi:MULTISPECIES: ATP-binding cassette domain-containing protein [Pedobacter]|uniref:ABC transporter related n=1 Tax=Pedobacter heparinus (strain ATCC 13125 / DSM 2366 / CIP 104194 / JCM 7457 / NBRC 12017 / NCIMB 9290 / NRRL B-14731 / HIM 762-3) TaxID=485917 RepID=C6XSI5_PEDHD|nr:MULTISPECIES: ABC transporter ATP-binding protein [Pedobacter]ACU05548.1 ABC transporter related [Pedobacter heparinus DSM 2366]MBB5440487.1 ABC-2 type transport system ATP-binding protein [Pedobacter sp. AK017]